MDKIFVPIDLRREFTKMILIYVVQQHTIKSCLINIFDCRGVWQINLVTVLNFEQPVFYQNSRLSSEVFYSVKSLKSVNTQEIFIS